MTKQLMIAALMMSLGCGMVLAQEAPPASQPADEPTTQPVDKSKNFKVTPAAARMLLLAMKNKNLDPEKYAARISASPQPDGKVNYGLDITDQIHENDLIITAAPLRIVLDKSQLTLLEGVTVDYRQGPEGSGFVFVHAEPTTQP